MEVTTLFSPSSRGSRFKYLHADSYAFVFLVRLKKNLFPYNNRVVDQKWSGESDRQFRRQNENPRVAVFFKDVQRFPPRIHKQTVCDKQNRKQTTSTHERRGGAWRGKGKESCRWELTTDNRDGPWNDGHVIGDIREAERRVIRTGEESERDEKTRQRWCVRSGLVVPCEGRGIVLFILKNQTWRTSESSSPTLLAVPADCIHYQLLSLSPSRRRKGEIVNNEQTERKKKKSKNNNRSNWLKQKKRTLNMFYADYACVIRQTSEFSPSLAFTVCSVVLYLKKKWTPTF